MYPPPHSSHTHTRQTALLKDVFPEHIAKALLEGKKVQPEHHECVTVIVCGCGVWVGGWVGGWEGERKRECVYMYMYMYIYGFLGIL